jgi:hypothetical protein
MPSLSIFIDWSLYQMRDDAQFQAAMSSAAEGVREILAHGFGSCKITVETVDGRKRKVLVETATSIKHTVPLEELPSRP